MKKMVLAFDFGSTYTDVLFCKGTQIQWTQSFEATTEKFSELRGIIETVPAASFVILTGSQRTKLFAQFCEQYNPPKQKLLFQEEIASLARGSRALVKPKKFLLVNIGTGTPFILVNNKTFRHLGGTGIGGGTLAGLAQLLLKTNVQELESLAAGSKGALDLSIAEVVGKKLGSIPPNATASNFAKANRTHRTHRKEMAFSLLKMVAESIAVAAFFASEASKCNTIVFTGRTSASNQMLQRQLQQILQMFHKKTIFPAKGAYCAALGAALLTQEKKQ